MPDLCPHHHPLFGPKVPCQLPPHSALVAHRGDLPPTAPGRPAVVTTWNHT